MKVVLDTNIWVSAVIWGGVPDEIVQLAEQGRITIAMSQELLDELEGTFNKTKLQPKLKALGLTGSTVIALIRSSVILYPIDELNVPELRDPDDTMVLATAIASQADAIITGDMDLRVLAENQGIKIMAAQDFIQQYFDLGS
ncbi:putative toxin-antitoxin system toxin component, PIN family [Planktothricoides raciborskii]|uniref:Toxin-antitoxin system toxin component, PIN family n=1 Tax=Planktothricoides raciborskii FACHB-1370 TaxID=2949576 RepID=A0ABR8EC75_9CYAN|nr:putative toxin-antitoxin system toxin component, PIN family [Planktothricoides raciborskii]MBD2544012.1 putative toxin-antitoxin system toxin component, PIN family [Planktothricoides raciborskii FACHB-1370]MBD2582496.1 putative toxin-antitoxin system toxin component, PIN family [Planktothricoides raciborskii FACHB-1261]